MTQTRTAFIAIVGCPNVGKSSILNRLLGQKIAVVSPKPQTTRTKIMGVLTENDVQLVFTDTPGFHRPRTKLGEKMVKAVSDSISGVDACLFVVEPSGELRDAEKDLLGKFKKEKMPVILAINKIDSVKQKELLIERMAQFSALYDFEAIVPCSALKGDGVMQAAEAAVKAAKSGKTIPMHTFSGPVEHAIAHIEEAAVHNMPEEQQRWYAIKIFERDDKVLEKLTIPAETMQHIESDIKAAEAELDDDAESIITNERYVYIAQIIKGCYKKKNHGQLSASDKIDKIVTNRWLGLPIFAVVMFLVYWVAMVGVGAPATDWANDGVFGDGWHLLGIGSAAYGDASDEYTAASEAVNAFAGIDTGDMLLTCSRPVPQDMTAGELFDLLSADGARLLCETLESMQNGTLHPQKQDGDAASYAPMLDKTMSPLDFQKSAKSLHDQVRGLQPWPTATCRFGDAVLKIHKTRVGGHTTEDAGVIVSLSPLSVACGDGGVLEILELQYPGSRRMAAADFLRGHPLCCGDRLH